MLAAITVETRKDYSRHDCVVIVFLSHGTILTNDNVTDPNNKVRGEVVCGTDGRPVRVEEDVRRKFCGVPSLYGKPKLIFVQACQGGKSYEV